MTTQNKVLLAQCYALGKEGSDQVIRRPSEYREYLIETYPEMKKWAKKEVFEQIEEWSEEVDIRLYADEVNLVGRLLADNIQTPSTVIDPPVNPDMLIFELEKDSYSHVGFSLTSNDFPNFIKCTEAVKNFDPSIKIIAGGYGAMFEHTKRHADYVCVGRGVPFLRNLLNENVTRPFNLSIIPDHIHMKYKNTETVLEVCRIVTKLGCPLHCDFCPTPPMFQGKYTGELFSPQQVHDALVQYRDRLGIDKLQVYFVDPTTIFSFDWWYEFFSLFKEDYGDFGFIVYALAYLLPRLDLDKLTKSAARIYAVNFGIESLGTSYIKTKNTDLKSMIKRLKDYGIITNTNYIIGYDFDTHESVWKDINKLIALEADINSVFNLHAHPKTSIWERLATQNRLLDLPPEFYYIPGFQAFTHPHFKPGFENILPLLCDINNHIQRETGNPAINLSKTLENALNYTDHPKIIKREIKSFRSIGKMIYPKWKQYFEPSERQDLNYLKKLQ